jgi:hypothetical protein
MLESGAPARPRAGRQRRHGRQRGGPRHVGGLCGGWRHARASGGAETITLAQANLPNVTLTTSIAARQGSHTHTTAQNGFSASRQTSPGGNDFCGHGAAITIAAATLPAVTGTTPLGGTGTALKIMRPSIICNYFLRVL